MKKAMMITVLGVALIGMSSFVQAWGDQGPG